jgi:hypothetical protein
MSYTQTLTMAQIRGTAGYNLGTSQNRFGGVGPAYNNMKVEATNDPSPLETIRQQTNKIEDWLDTLSEPIRPYVPPLQLAADPETDEIPTLEGSAKRTRG